MSKKKKKPEPMERPDLPAKIRANAEKAEAIALDISDKLDQLTRAKEARAEYLRLHRKWETAKEAAKEAKQAADDAASRMAAALDYTPLPLFDQAPGPRPARPITDEPSPAQQAAGLPISRLDLPETIARAIEKENLFTIGQLVDHIDKYETAASIKGIGPKAAATIGQAIAQVQRLFEEEEGDES